MTLLTATLGLALDLAAAVLLGWTTVRVLRSREKPSAKAFAAVTGTLTVWALFVLGEGLPAGAVPELMTGAFELGGLGAALFLPGVWTVYALGYTGRGTGLTPSRVAMLGGIGVPVALSGAVIATRPETDAVELTIASLAGAELLYLFSLYSYATYLLVGHARTHDRLRTTQAGLVVAGVSAPYVASAAGVGVGPVDPMTVGFLFSGTLLGASLRRYPVLTGFPKTDYVARSRVVEALQEAAVVLDWDDHVLDVNATTGRLFDVPPGEMVGRPVRSVVDGLDDTDLSAGSAGTVTLPTTNGRRRFQFTVSAVRNPGDGAGDEPIARAVLLRDVTDRLTREQQLSVLNRVLRHNLRNELDVVLAHAERIEDDDVRETIRDRIDDLLALGKTARDAEAVMDAGAGEQTPTDLGDLARDVAARYRAEFPEAEVSVACTGDVVVPTRPDVVEQVLSELVENALTHVDSATPRVEVRVGRPPDAAAELAVADDGPGIPERQRRILDEGTETQLEHAHGLGLWYVTWAVTQLGGELSFAENDPEGSVVTVRLYGAPTAD